MLTVPSVTFNNNLVDVRRLLCTQVLHSSRVPTLLRKVNSSCFCVSDIEGNTYGLKN